MNRKIIIYCLLLITLPISLVSQNVTLSTAKGDESFLRQDFYSAIEHYKQALKINSRDIKSNMGLSDSFFMIGEYEEALYYIEVCLKLSVQDLELHNRKARIFTALQRYNEAEEIYKKVIDREMYNVGAQSGLAELRIVNGDIEGSLYDFEKILRFSPESRRLLLSLVVLNDRQKEFSKADSLIQSALRYYPQDPIVLESAVKHYMASGNFNGASIYMDELINVSSNDELKLLQAELLIYLKEYESAISTLAEYMKVVKDNPNSFYLAAVALNSVGRGEQALALLKRAMDVRPDEEIYRFYSESIMNELYVIKDDKRKSYSEWYYNNGRNLESRYFYDKAKSYYLRGLDLDPLSYDLRYSYGKVLKKMGFHKKYLKELELILNHYEDKMDIKETLEIEQSLPRSEIYEKWGDDIFNNNNRFKLSVSVNRESAEYNLFSSKVITSVTERFLSGQTRFNIENVNLYNGDFSEAFNMARESESDFFILLSFLEGSRTFSLKATIHLTKSGREIYSFNYLKTGNNRIMNCFINLSSDLDKFFPAVGSVINIKGNDILIDLGLFNNIEKDKTFYVVKKGSLFLKPDKPYLSFKEDKLLGTAKIIKSGEGISECEFTPANTFNLLNIGDMVIPADEDNDDEDNEEVNPFVIDTELIEQLLQVN